MEPQKPSRMPLISLAVVLLILLAAFAFYYETSSMTISADQGSITTLKRSVSSLQDNVTSLKDADGVLMRELTDANGTISSQSSEIQSLSGVAGSQSSEVAGYQSTVALQVTNTITSQMTLDMPYNSSTTLASFQVAYAGYLQVSGTSTTYVEIAVCYGATSHTLCNNSLTYYAIDFGYGGATFNAPLEPGAVWINVFNIDPGTASLTVVVLT